MERKPLGRSGYEVSAIGLGCVTFGREIDEDASYRVMDYAMEKGIMLFDTAEIYGGAQSRLDRAQYLGFDEVREVAHEVSSSERS
jgi:aryl-alcohol dehydrogenase-like predicted oxidoreductase